MIRPALLALLLLASTDRGPLDQQRQCWSRYGYSRHAFRALSPAAQRARLAEAHRRLRENIPGPCDGGMR